MPKAWCLSNWTKPQITQPALLTFQPSKAFSVKPPLDQSAANNRSEPKTKDAATCNNDRFGLTVSFGFPLFRHH